MCVLVNVLEKFWYIHHPPPLFQKLTCLRKVTKWVLKDI